jgi:opacity protein-like surface antigen
MWFHRLSNVRPTAFLACFSCLLFGYSMPAQTLPPKTILEIRIQQPVSSYSTPKGTKITGIIISPVNDGGGILLPLGTTIEGSVLEVRKVGLGVAHETAEIDLNFDRLIVSNGQVIPLACRIVEVENARESINKKVRIQGIRSTSTLSSRTSGVVGTLAFGDPIAAIFTTAGSAGVLRFSEPEITLPAGTELRAELTAALTLPPEKAQSVPPIVTTEQGQLALTGLIRGLPFRTFTEGRKPVPSDLTNLVFIGSADALERAFAAGGWVIVDKLTAETTYSTVRSIAENQGYRSAPMSVLMLDGKAPDYAYAKTLNTFSKRHHLRIWTSSETWHGQQAWTSSSTHDIGIGFSKKNKTFIHLIDHNIDSERAKVVNDLIYTGCVSGVQLVTRPWLPRHPQNGTGEDLITDGRIAVLQLNGCEDPLDETSGEQPNALRTHGNELDRVTRQTVLTLKNNVIRDNVGVQAYSGIRYAVDSRKKHPKDQPERKMDINGNTYLIDATYRPQDGYSRDPEGPSRQADAPESVLRRKTSASWAAPSVELGFHGGLHGYYGGNGGAIALLFTQKDPPAPQAIIVLGNSFLNGWQLGGTVTLDSQKYFSHEFSYDYIFTGFQLGLTAIGHDSTTGNDVSEFSFAETGMRTSQFAYNFLLNGRPKTSRLRPYLAVGPALQLTHLDQAPIKKAPGWFRLGLSNIGLISAAYNFGSTPPLEGGGIFQVGLNYGGGVRYRFNPRWMVRADFRETLTSQPDFWTKSKKDILSNIQYDDGSVLTFVGPVLDGAMRQDVVTGGFSFIF